MSKIHELPESLANLIAAGEVVEGPHSIVKELCENSIDAHATKIDILVTQQSITVVDDGDGMTEDDVKLAFKRHATSKISKPSDLFKVNTLGFRGEALPTIASVAIVKLSTSTGEGVGTTIVIDNSVQVQLDHAKQKKGTKVIVSELFYKVPARLKHLETYQKEFYKILDVIVRLAYGYPNISFSLSNENKKIFFTSGNGKIIDIFATLNTVDVAKNMLELNIEDEDIKISGYISPIAFNRANRFGIFITLNNRYIYSPSLVNVITMAYRTYIPKDRYPLCIINVEVDPSLVDVNIHPSKQQVKLSNEDQIALLLTKAVRDLLQNKWQVPTIQIGDDDKPLVPQDIIFGESLESFVEKAISQRDFDNGIYIRVIGQHLGTYIIAELSDGLYLFDQHACQERINYEKFSNIFNNDVHYTKLITPILITLNPKEMLVTLGNKEKFSQLGIVFDIFGSNSIRITEVPELIKNINVQTYFFDMLEQLSKNVEVKLEDLQQPALKSMACKASIKANDPLTIESMTDLIRQLLLCQNPFTCPHGRPTMIKFTKMDLERSFKRTL